MQEGAEVEATATKKAIRARVAEAIRGLGAERKARLDIELIERARQFLFTRGDLHGGVFLAYLPLADEPDLIPLLAMLLEEGHTLALPRMTLGGRGAGEMVGVGAGPGGTLSLHHVRHLGADLVTGPFGVREPGPRCKAVAPKAVSLAILPGRAFTETGARLGRGKGFYDRLLATLPTAYRLALAYDEQVVPALPAEPHDAPIHHLITPTRWLEFGAPVS